MAAMSEQLQDAEMLEDDAEMLEDDRVDSELVNLSGKLTAHCVIDYCLPRHMYSSTLGDCSLQNCKVHLQAKVACVRDRLSRATMAFNSIMNNCPEHMLPDVFGPTELQQLQCSRQSTPRMPCEKLAVCKRVLIEDMGLNPEAVYRNLCVKLGKLLRECLNEDTVKMIGAEDTDTDHSVQITVPVRLMKDLGVRDGTGRMTVTTNESCERIMVNLAGTLYQTLLMLQILDSKSFEVDFIGVASSKALTIMPFSCTDRDLLLAWLGTMKQKQWLETKTVIGVKRPRKRRSGGINQHDVVYHCTGCAMFYKDLYVLNVRHEDIFRVVYDKKGQRKFGKCVSERRWINVSV